MRETARLEASRDGIRFWAEASAAGLIGVRAALDDGVLEPRIEGASSAREPLEVLSAWIEDWRAGAGVAPRPELDRSALGRFDREVSAALCGFARGESTTYGGIARSLGRPGAARAVGGAVGRNPWILVVPCHRVLATGGRLGGFSAGLALKRELLRREGIPFRE